MKDFRTTLNYLAFGAAFAGCFYTLIYLGTAGDPIPKEAAILHSDMCERSKADHCVKVAR